MPGPMHQDSAQPLGAAPPPARANLKAPCRAMPGTMQGDAKPPCSAMSSSVLPWRCPSLFCLGVYLTACESAYFKLFDVQIFEIPVSKLQAFGVQRVQKHDKASASCSPCYLSFCIFLPCDIRTYFHLSAIACFICSLAISAFSCAGSCTSLLFCLA